MVEYHRSNMRFCVGCAWIVILVALVLSLVATYSDNRVETECYPVDCQCTQWYRDDQNGTCVFYDVDLLYRDPDEDNSDVFQEVNNFKTPICPGSSTRCWVQPFDRNDISFAPEVSQTAAWAQLLFSIGIPIMWTTTIVDCVFR